MNKKTVTDVNLLGKRVLLRVDYNVPMDEDGNITDDARIRETLPTIHYLLSQGTSIVLMAHLGRPKGQVVESLRLARVAVCLGCIIGERFPRDIETVDDCIGPNVQQAVAQLEESQILMLENLRFHAEEEKNDEEFAAELAAMADVYVNDAFGAAHRAHASTEGVARIMRAQGKPCVAGLLMAKELDFLGRVVTNPRRPFVAILGGVKVSDKIGVIRNLLDKVDTLLVGGAMSYAFEKAQGREVGTSYFKADDAPVAAELLSLAKEKGADFRLPQDFLVADRDAEDAQTRIVPAGGIPADMMGMDIGPATIADYSKVIEGARTVLWNGPMGRFEVSPFANGTKSVAQAVGRATAHGATTVIGGGDSAAAVKQMGLADRMTHVSTGGGASLEFLEGIELPGVAVLDDK